MLFWMVLRMVLEWKELWKQKKFITYSHENMLFVNPPLIITEEQIKEEMLKMDEVLSFVDSEILSDQLPQEIMDEIGIEVFDYEKFEYDSFQYDNFRFDTFSPDTFQYDKFGITILRRGVIGVGKVGYE